MKRLLPVLARIGLRRGLRGGSRVWLAIGVTATGLRLLGKYVGKEPKVVYCEDLAPGETLVIRHLRRDGG